MTPNEIRGAYGLGSYTAGVLSNGISFGSGIQGDGSGQTIAIVDAYDDPTALNDLQAFSTYFGLPTFGGPGDPTFQKLGDTGGAPPIGTDPNGDWEVEESLDIEWAHAMAPMANIILFEAPDAGNGLFTAVQTAANTSGVVAASMSWGGSEFSGEQGFDTYFTTPSGHLGGSATLGGTDMAGDVTFLASAGDSGAYAPGTATIAPQYPATSPNVVAVGGTTLTVFGSNPNYTYGGETAWGDGTFSGFDGGGGGGISGHESQPAYQKGVVNAFSTTNRTYPDVCADADPNSGVSYYDTYNNGVATPWDVVGGTSLACPLWAGIIAVADQGRAIVGKGSLDGPGQTLPDLYNLYKLSPNDLHDITTGNNGYAAGVGYDLATGIGSPAANLLVPTLTAGPSVATAAAANPNPVTGTTTPVNGTNLTVQGIEGGSEAGLTYTWATTVPPGATPPSFSINGTAAANDTTATFSAAGTYVFTVAITDQNGLTGYSSVTVAVDQTVTSIAVSPNPVTVNVGATQQFTVVAFDQFGTKLTTEPAYTATWTTTVGSINPLTGLFTAPASVGSGTVTASNVTFFGSSGTFTASSAVTITALDVSLSDATVVEVNWGSTTVQVPVQLTGLHGTYVAPVTIDYRTWDNSPQSGAATGTADPPTTPPTPANYQSVTNGTLTITAGQLTSAQQNWTPLELTADVGSQYQYAVWQNDVVWQGSSGQILFNNGASTQQLSPLGSNSQFPAIDGTASPQHPYVVWSQAVGGYQQIFVCQIGAGANGANITTQLTSDAWNDSNPQIFGTSATWWGNTFMGQEIFYDADITNANPASVTSMISPSGVDSYSPQISGTTGAAADTYVVWYGSHSSQGAAYQDVYLYDANANQTTAITGNNLANQGQTLNESDRGVQIDGSNVVWQGSDAANYQIFLYQIGTATTTEITSDPIDNVDPHISGNNIVWTKDCTIASYESGETVAWTSQIYDYNIGTTTTTQISDGVAAAEHAQISGNLVVWHEMVSGSPEEWNVYCFDLNTPATAAVDVSNSQRFDWYPLVSSTGMVAWTASLGAEYDIFTANQPTAASVTATINLTVFGNTRIEPDEVFFVTAKAAVNEPLVIDRPTATVTILNANGNLDYGSAPSPYPTSLADDGARHLVVAGEYLGTSEASANGVVFNSSIMPSSTASVTLTASVPGKLDAWIDFNDNGSWNDPGEEIFTDVSLAAGPNTLTFAVPAGALGGPTWARFRYSLAGGLAPTGMAMDGEVEDYRVEITPQPPDPASGPGSVVRSGGTVTVTGTSGSDVFAFTAGAKGGTSEVVNFDGTTYTYPAGTISKVIFLGGGGQDSAFLNGSAGNTTVSLQPASTGIASTLVDDLKGTEVKVTVSAVQYILATSGGGANDTAQLFDSPGNDTATLRPDDVTMTGTGFSLEALGFPIARAYSTKGGSNVANFGDLPNAVSTLVATSQSAQLTSRVGAATISNYAQGFTSYYATASNAADQAELIDYQGNSTLTATGTTSKLYANNGSYLIQVSGFGRIQAFGRGGNDDATMSDTAGSAKSTFTAGPGLSNFTGPGFNDTAYNFLSVVATAQSTADTTTLSDAANNNNTLVDKPLDVLFFGIGFKIEAKQFTTTIVNSLSTGTDTAFLYDLAGVANTMVASPDKVTLSANNAGGTPAYSNTVNFFSQVVAAATAGNGDTASFFDGLNAAVFTSGWNSSIAGNLSTMTGHNSKGWAYSNQAKLFQHIQFNPAPVASHPADQIFLTDSPGSDSLVAGTNSVKLSSVQAGYLFDILIQNIVGDTVTATDIASSTDTKSVAAASDYVLKMTGVW
jgi:hypothetical protein